MKTADGEIYFGGVKGLNYFYPKHLTKLTYQPSVHLYNLKINEEPYLAGKQANEAQHISLAFNQNTFSLEFSAIDYYSNGRNQYQYFLQG